MCEMMKAAVCGQEDRIWDRPSEGHAGIQQLMQMRLSFNLLMVEAAASGQDLIASPSVT